MGIDCTTLSSPFARTFYALCMERRERENPPRLTHRSGIGTKHGSVAAVSQGLSLHRSR